MVERRSPTVPAELEAGRVGRPHGLDGSFYVTAPRARLLSPGTNVAIGGRPHAIVRVAGMGQRPIVRVEGVEDRAAAQALRGRTLTVALEEAPALEPGEWWAHELEGCEVRCGGRHVGIVRALLELPSCEVLEVQRPRGAELLVPMVGDAVRAVDVAAGTIEVDLDFLGEAGPAAAAGAAEGGSPAPAGGAASPAQTGGAASPAQDGETGSPGQDGETGSPAQAGEMESTAPAGGGDGA